MPSGIDAQSSPQGNHRFEIFGDGCFSAVLTIPAKSSPSRKTVQTATNWDVRIRRNLGNKVAYDTDYGFRVAG